MGTNYYIVKKCWFCGNIKETHIGKSSAGWKFLLQINDEYKSDIQSLWKYLKWKKVEDEYHRKTSRKELFKLIKNKQVGKNNELCNVIDEYSFEWSAIEFS